MSNWSKWVFAAAAALAMAGCGGGGGGHAAVTNVSAIGVAYNRTLTVTVNGAGLIAGGITMSVDGPCGDVSKSAGGTELQAVFTCRVSGIGPLVPRIRDASGTEQASMRFNIPSPQVTVSARQGDVSGSFVLELDPVAAPLTTKNFMDYVAAGFYTNTLFHSVAQGSLVRGGAYTTGPILKANSNAPIELESSNGLKNLRATIGMDRGTVVNSATSQFYINLVDNPQFDRVDDAQPGFAVFGKVVTGMDTVDRIGSAPIGTNVQFPTLPAADVVITFATQTQ